LRKSYEYSQPGKTFSVNPRPITLYNREAIPEEESHQSKECGKAIRYWTGLVR